MTSVLFDQSIPVLFLRSSSWLPLYFQISLYLDSSGETDVSLNSNQNLVRFTPLYNGILNAVARRLYSGMDLRIAAGTGSYENDAR
ncbi:hypothetical protein TSTA_120710 [Talaromyces stipitatus ATCC 10500]|uniref:Uncharacterized protein n=1 Tax=Talaromyces stipitatus (strain ATCC 10500 / CBS 375.48 / QM 6759 / NRRL 1006) TaxID=441959 RepID=B8MDU6_TALSN|nr:uncharacterized protein TSTA_120710 [Talaromyces stipitatus ATCC 10500]EED18325.1 hypothetical protein TSTA_120710 [Talaromyces stipitatus ATCC 10500]